MNVAEKYFKNKINWKIFNNILDACTVIEDSGNWFKLQVCVYNEFFGDWDYVFCYISRRSRMDDNGNIIDSFEAYQHFTESCEDEKVMDVYRKRYEKSGFCYVLIAGEVIDYDKILPKINKVKVSRKQRESCVFTEINN